MRNKLCQWWYCCCVVQLKGSSSGHHLFPLTWTTARLWYLNLSPLVELCENFWTYAVTCHVSISNLTFLSHRSWLLFSITSNSPPLPSTHVLSTSSVLHLHQCFYFSLPSPLTPFRLASPCFLIPPVLFLRLSDIFTPSSLLSSSPRHALSSLLSSTSSQTHFSFPCCLRFWPLPLQIPIFPFHLHSALFCPVLFHLLPVRMKIEKSWERRPLEARHCEGTCVCCWKSLPTVLAVRLSWHTYTFSHSVVLRLFPGNSQIYIFGSLLVCLSVCISKKFRLWIPRA